MSALAFVSAVVAAPAVPQDRQGKKSNISEPPPTAQEIPLGSAIIAVVDPIDEDAVLEMLAITPGPRVLRRHSGQWFEDPEWIGVLKSVKPPNVVKLTESQVASVSAQVDRSTDDQDWEPFEAENREQYQICTASAGRSHYLQELQRESDEKALFALVAVAGREVTIKDRQATERLKRYWTVGKGAAKIRWGTPGSWRRCYRHLVKYVGPKIAPGYCTNLSKRLGGPGIATHVTSSADPVTSDAVMAANPTGINGYDKGQKWRDGQTKRDHFGRFSGGSGGTARARRRRKSARGRTPWYEAKGKWKIYSPEDDPDVAKKKKKAEADAKKIADDRERAKREAQQKELADISLAIAQASAAGNTVQAAELRVKRAERVLAFADTEVAKINAQTALINARAALARARRASTRRKPTSSSRSRQEQIVRVLDRENSSGASRTPPADTEKITLHDS